MRVISIILATVLFSCKAKKSVSPIVFKPQNIEFAELNKGTNGDFPKKINQVILNQNEYNEVWEAAFSRFSDKQKPAKIDFKNKMILFVAMGEKNSGGYTIKINSIKETETTIVVTVKELKPGSNCMTTSVMTYPYQIVELKNSKKEVVFNAIEEIYNCEK